MILNALTRAGGIRRTAAEKRKHYSDTDEVRIVAARPVILNGITNFVTRGDLDSRALHIESEDIPGNERQLESELDEQFELLRSKILGGLYDAVSAALRNRDSVRPEYRLPRKVMRKSLIRTELLQILLMREAISHTTSRDELSRVECARLRGHEWSQSTS